MRAQMMKRMLGFAGLPLLSLLTPFLLLPIIARIGGSTAWVALNLGQSVGALAAVLASLGWTLVGPAAIAAAGSEDRARLYGESVAARVPSTALAAVIGSSVCLLLADPGQRVLAVGMTVAMAASALSPTWYSIGIGSARAIAVYETLPRLAATVVAAVVVLTTGALWCYPVLLLVVVVGGAVAFGARVAGVPLRRVRWRGGVRSAWAMRTSTATVATASCYALAPMPLATAFSSTAAAATFGSADRLFRIALTAIQVCMNAFQSWVADPATGGIHRSNARAASGVTIAIGVAGLLVFALVGPALSGLLFGAPLAATPVVSACYGVALLAIAVSSALGRLVLIPLGRERTVFGSTVAGAVVGVSAMLALGAAAGGSGVAAGFAASEVAVAVYQGVALLRGRVRR